MPPMRVRGYLAAIPSVIREHVKTYAYRVYVTDALKAIADNTMHIVGGSSMRLRWLDVVDPAPEPVVDNRPAEEIAADIWARARIGKGGE